MNVALRKVSKGFTLIEMMLVMVIISAFIVMGSNYIQQRTLSLRIDRTNGQMQQILNAAIAYYVTNGQWPPDLATLQTNNYLPSTASTTSPWASTYKISSDSNNFYVYVQLPSMSSKVATAQVIAGTLPMGFTTMTVPTSPTSPTKTTCTSTPSTSVCYAAGSVNAPGQDLSSAGTVNFVNYYHNGACVPVPPNACLSGFSPQILVSVAEVNALFDKFNTSGTGTCTPTDTSGCTPTYYPLSGFTAYYTDPVAYKSGSTSPVACDGSTAFTPCYQTTDATGATTEVSDGGTYWRVCLSVMSQSGRVNPTGTYAQEWGQLTGRLLVIVRCMPNSQSNAVGNTNGATAGSNFNVWGSPQGQ